MNTKPTKSAVVGLKELRHNMEEYIERVRKGESLTIVRRSKPIFRLSPVDEEESEWETVMILLRLIPMV
jgi:prevent-host-death family protein